MTEKWVNYIAAGYDEADGLGTGRWMRDAWGVVRWVDTGTPGMCQVCRHRPVGPRATACNTCQTRIRRQKAAAQPHPQPLAELLACVCGATVTSTCISAGGNPTSPHKARVIERRCGCGRSLANDGRHPRYCNSCRQAARAETYRKREIRTPTAERRAA